MTTIFTYKINNLPTSLQTPLVLCALDEHHRHNPDASLRPPAPSARDIDEKIPPLQSKPISSVENKGSARSPIPELHTFHPPNVIPVCNEPRRGVSK